MKIKIEIDVPEYVGGTVCLECPFSVTSPICQLFEGRCYKLDFSRMKIKEYEDNTRDTSTINRD